MSTIIKALFYFNILIFVVNPCNSIAGSIDPSLVNILASSNRDDSNVDVIIKFADTVSLPLVENTSVLGNTSKLSIASSVTKGQLVKSLLNNSVNSQKYVRSTLGQFAIKIKNIWINNSIAATIPKSLIPQIALLPNVSLIKEDRKIVLATESTGEEPTQLDWNITSIGANLLWDVGVTGKGVVIGSVGTGVDINHPDLITKWRGGNNSWFDPYGTYSTPYDPNGHGTQTTSLMVGGNASGYNIGVAPEAKWIAAKIFDDSDMASISAIHLAFQWMLDPDGNPDTDDGADIVNNSWNFGTISNQCDDEFQDDILILRSADVAVIFSAGNSGPNPDTSHSPANNEDTIPVGAIDESLNVAFFSSRGGSACDNESIYPKLTAPGVNVLTADLTFGGVIPNSYTYSSGTSYAAPHVSAALALLQSKFPSSSLSEREQALYSTAALLGPTNDYGNGFIDVQAAMSLMGTAQLISPTGNLELGTTPIFTWNPVLDTTHYNLWIKDPNGIVNQVWYTDDQASCTDINTLCKITSIPLDINGYYSWRVRTKNEVGLGPWSSEQKFSAGFIPEIPTPIDPAGNIVGDTPKFTWNDVPGATAYRFFVLDLASSSPRLKDIIYTDLSALGCGTGSGICTAPALGAPLPNGNYRWRVQALNSNGLAAGWSAKMDFTVGTSPDAPIPIDPSDNYGSNTPVYTWNEVLGATAYRFFVLNLASSSPRLEDTIYTDLAALGCGKGSGICTAPALTAPLSNGNYRWRVQAINSVGRGVWSVKKNFTIGTMPEIPITIDPLGNVESNKPVYIWNEVPGATAYRFFVLNLASSSPRLIDTIYTDLAALGCGTGSGICTAPALGAPLPDGNYRWRVQAINSDGWGDWSVKMNFNITTP